VATRFGNGCFEIRNYRETIQRKIYFFGYWERRETLLVRRLLRPGDVFIDVGANLGWFTVLAARCVGPTGKVVSFEPCGRHYEHLQSNLRLNQLTNVIPEKLALSDTAGTAVLSGMHERNEGLGTIIGGSDRRGETVSTVRFDDYWAATGYDTTIRIIKMDIEGAEIKALLGMADTLRRKLCEYLIIEVSKKDLRRAGATPEDVLGLLASHGYGLYRIGTRAHHPLDVGFAPETGFINVLAVRSEEELRLPFT